MDETKSPSWAGIKDLIAVIVIALLGLFTAYVTFGILESTTEGKIGLYSVSGAIAGALVTSSLLASIYLQFRKSSDEVQTLHRRIEELQYRVMRGAPRPEGFETEVDERHRLVLARPENWASKGGLLYDLCDHDVTAQTIDIFPSQFRVYYHPLEGSDAESYYSKVIEEWDTDPVILKPVSEYIMVGGEEGPIKTLKLSSRQYVRFELTEKHPVSGRTEWSWWPVTEEEFNEPPKDPDDANLKIHYFEIVRMYVCCYHPGAKGIFSFGFVDDADDFLEASATFNRILGSVRYLT